MRRIVLTSTLAISLLMPTRDLAAHAHQRRLAGSARLGEVVDRDNAKVPWDADLASTRRDAHVRPRGSSARSMSAGTDRSRSPARAQMRPVLGLTISAWMSCGPSG